MLLQGKPRTEELLLAKWPHSLHLKYITILWTSDFVTTESRMKTEWHVVWRGTKFPQRGR